MPTNGKTSSTMAEMSPKVIKINCNYLAEFVSGMHVIL